MGARIRAQIAQSKSEKRIKEFVVGKVTEAIQKVNDASLYFSGANEQLLLQQGQMMTVQAGIIEWLDQHLGRPGFTPSDQIKVICEANIARAKAEREAREAEAKKRADKAPITEINQLAEQVSKLGGIPDVIEAPADIAPEAPADAPADTPGSP